MEAKHVTEARWLSIPLFCAERAWSYGMKLKHELKEGDHPRYRFRLIKRFAKVRHSLVPWSHVVMTITIWQ